MTKAAHIMEKLANTTALVTHAVTGLTVQGDISASGVIHQPVVSASIGTNALIAQGDISASGNLYLDNYIQYRKITN